MYRKRWYWLDIWIRSSKRNHLLEICAKQ